MQAYLPRNQTNSAQLKGNAVAQKKSAIDPIFQLFDKQDAERARPVLSSAIVQRTKADVQNDLKGNKYNGLAKWNSQINEALSGTNVTIALSNVITNTILTAVQTDDENTQRIVYDDLRKLINRYNNNNHAFKIDANIVPSLPPRNIQSRSEYISGQDSPSYLGMSQEETVNNFNRIFSNKPQIVLKDKQDNSQSIPVLSSFAQAGRAIRYQQFAKESIPPNPFAVQQGDVHTLFEYRTDYVANPLRQQDEAYLRDGQIGSWAELIKQIDSTTTVQNIIDIINGKTTTQPTQIQSEVAGAMVADTKRGIQNWITIMNDIPGDTTIKNLLTTVYKGFVDSRSYKTDKQGTGSNMFLGGQDPMKEEIELEDDDKLYEIDGMLMDAWDYDEYMEYKMKVDF